MNLFWLKYVSYACVAGALYFYFILRWKGYGASGKSRLTSLAICIVLACVTWHLQESNTDRNSPRQVIVGTVTSVRASVSKSGSVSDHFQLRVQGGALSPRFSTDIVASRISEQPIHQGDVLGVLYRTWDNVPLTIDEFQGQRPGWHYRRYRFLDPYVWSIGSVGFLIVAAILIGSLMRGRAASTSAQSIPDSTA